MAYNFSANQYEKSFKARDLCNWEVPKWYPTRPRHRKVPTAIIANDRGHLLPNIPRPPSDPWGNHKNSWQLPEKLTRSEAEKFNEPLVGKNRWGQFTRQRSSPKDPVKTKSKSASRAPNYDRKEVGVNVESGQSLDLEYIPGDYTTRENQHPSRHLLVQEKQNRDLGIEPEVPLNDLYLEKHICENPPPDQRIPPSADLPLDVKDNFGNMYLSYPSRKIPDKPNERSPSPIIPAYCNFQMAKQMHQENLEHQPLPDCVADQAYRKMQAQGSNFPGLTLDMDPLATGVGVKTYKAGPTHCTKMKVYRPKTVGVVPKVYSGNEHYYDSQHAAATAPGKKMGSMDLAIRWDYRPANRADEPKLPRHIDGSNDSAGPAIFTVVRTPRSPERLETGRSGGVFTNTFGELGFFDKDVLRRKTAFTQKKGKCSCGTSPIQFDEQSHQQRSKSVSRDGTASTTKRKRCQSSPNLSEFAISGDQKVHTCSKYGAPKDGGASAPKPSFFRKTARMCYKVAPSPYPPEPAEKPQFKSAFKAGRPKPPGSGFDGSDGGYSSMSSGSCSTTNKVLVIPRPRNPYSKKNYNIETLVPPFTCIKGGAGQGGYPEHWRLASVYQHAYKPIEQRRKALLQTVFK